MKNFVIAVIALSFVSCSGGNKPSNKVDTNAKPAIDTTKEVGHADSVKADTEKKSEDKRDMDRMNDILKKKKNL